MKKNNLTPSMLANALLFMLASPNLFAQSELSNSIMGAPIEIITVTANKIEEDLIDVPKSVTVVSETLVDEMGMKDVNDLLDIVPDLEVFPMSPGRTVVNIRGLNSSLFTNNNPIVIYVDGIPYSDSYGFDLSLVDVERVEILRGPQATLYGKDAIGGVVSVFSKAPSNEWSGKFEAEYGSFNAREFNFSTSGALKDDEFYFSLSGQYRADDGWVTNSFPGNESDANKFENQRVSATMTYQPTDALSVKFVASNDNNESFGIGGYGELFTDPKVASQTASLSVFNRARAEKINAENETREESKTNSQALQVAYDFDSFTLSSVTTRRNQKFKGFYDFDEGDNPILVGSTQFDNQDTESWTQELILRSNNAEGLRYVAGVYFDKGEREQGPYGQKFLGTTYNAESVTDTSTASIFGQIIYPLTEPLELTLGGRYQRIEVETDLKFMVENLPVAPTFTEFFTGLAHTMSGKKDWSVFLPRAALTYQLNDNWTSYAAVSKGYMPGGFNYFATSGTAEQNGFEPQQSTNYEIGLKAQTNRATFAATAFYMQIEGIHVFRLDKSGNYFTSNADKAHSQGVEFEVAYQVSDALELSASVGLIDAEYDDYFAGVFDYSGQDVEQTPDYTFNLSATYYHPRGFYARADLSAVGKTTFFDGGRPSPATAFPERDAYAVVNARIGYHVSDDWEIYAYANNLADEDYVTFLRSTNLGSGVYSIATFNDPRSFGVGLRYRF